MANPEVADEPRLFSAELDGNKNVDVGETLPLTKKNSENYLDRLLHQVTEKGQEKLELWQVMIYVFKAFVGTGMLGLPSAVAHAGLIAGPVLIIGLGAMCMYSIQLLVNTARRMQERYNVPAMSYSMVSYQLFSVYGTGAGKTAKYVTDLLLCVLQLGFCCVYIVFISHNIQVAFNRWDVRVWMVLLLPFLFVEALIANIRRLSYMIMLANMIVLVGLGIIFQHLVVSVQNPEDLPFSTNFFDTALATGQMVYAFEGIAVVLPVEKRVKERQAFDWLFKLIAVAVVLLYLTISILGYATYGAHTLGSISLNLPQTGLYQTLQSFYALMVFLAYPLQLYLTVEIVKGYMNFENKGRRDRFIDEVIIKCTLIAFTCVMAICIPQLDNFMALVGAFSGVCVSMILPPLLHLLYHRDQQVTRFEIVIDLIIIATGILACVCGTMSSLYSIVHRYIKTGGVKIQSGGVGHL